jgi:hypothetical protein
MVTDENRVAGGKADRAHRQLTKMRNEYFYKNESGIFVETGIRATESWFTRGPPQKSAAKCVRNKSAKVVKTSIRKTGVVHP